MTIGNFNITPPPRVMSAREEAFHKSEGDLIYYGKLFLYGDFRKSPSPACHYIVADDLLNTSVKYLANIIARGHGKTILTKALILHIISFYSLKRHHGAPVGPPPFMVWIADNIDKAFNNMDYIEKQILYNKVFIYYFGKLSGKASGLKFNEHYKEFKNGQTLISRSNLKMVRGETKANIGGGSERFHIAFLDDIENEENTKTAEARALIKRRVGDAVYPALDPHFGRMIINATPLHDDSFCADIIRSKNVDIYNESGDKVEAMWKVNFFPATQPRMPHGVLWYPRFSKKVLIEKKNWYMSTFGSTLGYYQEYELQVRSEQSKVWTRQHLSYHNSRFFKHPQTGHTFVITEEGLYIPANFYIGCDPATDINTERADFTCIMVIAYLMNYEVHAMEYFVKKDIRTIGLYAPDGRLIGDKGTVEVLVDMYDSYSARHAVVEDVTVTRGLMNDFDAWKMKSSRHDVHIIPEPPSGREKLNKIKTGLNPMLSTSRIKVRREHDDLINQIVSFGPSMKHDDVVESLFFATRYMSVPPDYSKDTTSIPDTGSSIFSADRPVSSWKGSQRRIV